MKLTRRDRGLVPAAMSVLCTLAPMIVHADDHHLRHQHAAAVQNNKNTMRNLALGGAAVAGYGLLTHNTTATVAGAAGAALAGNAYENARKEQSKAAAARHSRRHHRHH